MVVLYKLMYEAFGNDRFTEKVEGEILADLIIDKRYYNTLDIEGFSKMMNSPSYCYKFYWLEAIVQLISANKTEATYDEIINKMISNAWYPVLEFHIHLSGIYGEGIIKDNLEKAVLRLQEISNLANNASDVEIINKNLVITKKNLPRMFHINPCQDLRIGEQRGLTWIVAREG